MKAVHFGAGNIGRGFIGLVLSQAGFHVCFVDINDTLVDLLNEHNQYTVTLANEKNESLVVRNISAVHGQDQDLVAQRIAEAQLVTTAIGFNNLQHIARSLARGITLRAHHSADPLTVIACENGIGAGDRLKEYVYGHLSAEVRAYADGAVSFPNAMVDRIVPNAAAPADPTSVVVEPFYEWVVERTPTGCAGQELDIKGVHFVDDLKPYLERKLYTVNTGHCAAAYLGYLKGYTTIQNALADSELRRQVLNVLGETGEVLIRKFAFDRARHENYIRTTIERFANPRLSDDVTRVARSPIRKLAKDERLVGPALDALAFGLQPRHLALAIAAAFRYDYENDDEAAAIQSFIESEGIDQAITRFTSLAPKHPLHGLIVEQYTLTAPKSRGSA